MPINIPVYNNDKNLVTDGTTREGKEISFYHVPSGSTIKFKAFITNFNDQFNCNWESEPIYGRMDPVKTFSATERTITLDFDVVAANLEEAIHNLSSVSALAKFHYPSYKEGHKSTTAINESPLIRVKYMNWICRADNPEGTAKESGLLVASSGFSFAPDITDLTYSHNGKLYPKIISISTNLEVIHEHGLGWEGETPRNNTDKFPYNQDTAKEYQTVSNAMRYSTDSVPTAQDLEDDRVIRQNDLIDPASDVSDEERQAAIDEFITGQNGGNKTFMDE